METLDYDNETWIRHLRDDESRRQAAVVKLRAELLRNLKRALDGRAGTDDALLEDFVQDSLVRILSHLDQFEGRSRFVTWATAIAIRVAMSELRKRRWKDVSLDELRRNEDFTPVESNNQNVPTSQRMDRKALVDKLYYLIQNDLTDKQRTALLAELRGMPQDEIARQLGSNRNALYKLTHDARRRLRHGLEAAGYRASDIHAAFAN